MRERYFRLDPKAYGMPLSEEDFAYTWANLQGLSEFYARAAKAGDRAVVFTGSTSRPTPNSSRPLEFSP